MASEQSNTEIEEVPWLCRPLDIKDLYSVLKSIKECQFSYHNWIDLGLALGLYKGTLDKIQSQDVNACMRECLSKWLEKADNVVSSGVPTLERLGDVLEELEDRSAADKIRGIGTQKHLHVNEPQPKTFKYSTPFTLEKEYCEKSYCFSGILISVVEDALKKKKLEKIKLCLASVNATMGDQIKEIQDGPTLMQFLRKYCYFSNFEMLTFLVEKLNLKDSIKKLKSFTDERNSFYSRILAEDFAKEAIEDHKTAKHETEIIFVVSIRSNSMTLYEFEDFLRRVFENCSSFISLKAVHQSLLTFVCTIPIWFIDEVTVFVKKMDKEILKSEGVVKICIDINVIFETELLLPTTSSGSSVLCDLSLLTGDIFGQKRPPLYEIIRNIL